LHCHLLLLHAVAVQLKKKKTTTTRMRTRMTRLLMSPRLTAIEVEPGQQALPGTSLSHLVQTALQHRARGRLQLPPASRVARYLAVLQASG